MTDEDWEELISRLEHDLARRAGEVSASPPPDDPWRLAWHKLYDIARQLVDPVEAEDIVQTVLLRLQQRDTLHRLRASRSPKGYATVVVRNAMIDALRRKRRWVPSEIPELLWNEGWPEQELQDERRAEKIHDALQELTDSERELLRQRFWYGLSMAEIARALNLPYTTVAVRMFRLLRRLRGRLVAGEFTAP